MYLRAACLLLNVLENQTIECRLCRFLQSRMLRGIHCALPALAWQRNPPFFGVNTATHSHSCEYRQPKPILGFPLSGVVYFNTIVFYIINKGYDCITIFVISRDKKSMCAKYVWGFIRVLTRASKAIDWRIRATNFPYSLTTSFADLLPANSYIKYYYGPRQEKFTLRIWESKTS